MSRVAAASGRNVGAAHGIWVRKRVRFRGGGAIGGRKRGDNIRAGISDDDPSCKGPDAAHPTRRTVAVRVTPVQIGILVLNTLALALTFKSRELGEEVRAMRALEAEERAHLDADAAILAEAIEALRAVHDPHWTDLALKKHILEKGDPRILNPDPETFYLFRFDELL